MSEVFDTQEHDCNNKTIPEHHVITNVIILKVLKTQ